MGGVIEEVEVLDKQMLSQMLEAIRVTPSLHEDLQVEVMKVRRLKVADRRVSTEALPATLLSHLFFMKPPSSHLTFCAIVSLMMSSMGSGCLRLNP